MADSSHESWLATLKPDVRLHVEAEIAFYDNEDLWDWKYVEDDDDDGEWAPGPIGGMGLMVDFDAEDVQLMFEAFGRGADFASMMKQMLLGRVEVDSREIINPTSTAISAGASGLGE